MPEYIIAYHHGDEPETPEEGAEGMAKWQAWIGGLGNAVVNPGTPLGMNKFVTQNGVLDEGGSSRLTGFTVVRADNIEVAVEMAKACPFLEVGTLQVAEMMEMQPPTE